MGLAEQIISRLPILQRMDERLTRSQWQFPEQYLVDQARELIGAFRNLSDEAYAAEVERRLGAFKVLRQPNPAEPITNEQRVALREEYLVLALAVAQRELSKPGKEFDPRGVQVEGAIYMLEGMSPELKSGEGKTFAIALAAGWQVLNGRRAQIHTDKDTNAWAGAEAMAPFYRRLGITKVGVIDREGKLGQLEEGKIVKIKVEKGGLRETKRAIYEGDVVYLEHSVPGHDFLRDDLWPVQSTPTADRASEPNLVVADILGLKGKQDRELAIFVDEADEVALGESPLVIAGNEALEAAEWREQRLVLEAVWRAVNPDEKHLERYVDYARQADPNFSGDVKVLKSSFDRQGHVAVIDQRVSVGGEFVDLLVWLMVADEPARVSRLLEELEFKFPESPAAGQAITVSAADIYQFFNEKVVEADIDLIYEAAQAKYGLERDQDYRVVTGADGKQAIELIHREVGTRLPQQKFQGWAQQFLELKEGLEPSAPTLTLNSITLTLLYHKLSRKNPGRVVFTSGTLLEYGDEIEAYFGSRTIEVTPSGEGKVELLPPQVYTTQEAKLEAIARLVHQAVDARRPVLIYERQPKVVARLKRELERIGVKAEQMQELSVRTEERFRQKVLGVGVTGKMVHQELLSGSSQVVTAEMSPRGLNLPIGGGLIIFSGMSRSAAFDQQVVRRLGGLRGSGQAIQVLGPEDTILLTKEPVVLRQINRLMNGALSADYVPDAETQLSQSRAADVARLYGLLQRRQTGRLQDVRRFRFELEKVSRAVREDVLEFAVERKGQVEKKKVEELWDQVLKRMPAMAFQVSSLPHLQRNTGGDMGRYIHGFGVEFARVLEDEVNDLVVNRKMLGGQVKEPVFIRKGGNVLPHLKTGPVEV